MGIVGEEEENKSKSPKFLNENIGKSQELKTNKINS